MIIETVRNPIQGLRWAKRLLYKHVDRKTALFLSGGYTPKLLYKNIELEKKLHPGSVALVDERYGQPFHPNSNERMVRQTGFIDYLETQNIPFYSPLHDVIASERRERGDPRLNLRLLRRLREAQAPRNDIEYVRRHLKGVRLTAKEYNETVKQLFLNFPKRIAIMGMGEDGHTAGLPAKSQISILRQAQDKSQKYVIRISDFPGEFRERITLTFSALAKMDLLIVLVFGEKKKRALELMFKEGPIEEIPARFYNLPDITEKVVVITDQRI